LIHVGKTRSENAEGSGIQRVPSKRGHGYGMDRRRRDHFRLPFAFLSFTPGSSPLVNSTPEPHWMDQARDNCEDHKEEGPYYHGKPSHGRSQNDRGQPSEPKPKLITVGGDTVHISHDKSQKANDQSYYHSYIKI